MNKQEAIDAFGSVTELADALGISREAIYQWGNKIPRGRSFEIMALLEQGKDKKLPAPPSDAA